MCTAIKCFISFLGLYTILVPPISLGLELAPREAVKSIGNHNAIQKQLGRHFLVAFPRLFGNFSASVPFLDKLVLGDLVAGGDGSTGHASAGSGSSGPAIVVVLTSNSQDAEK